MTEPRLAGVLANLPDGLTEIYSHPATSNTFDGAVPGYRYADELNALVSAQIVSAIAANGIRLTTYTDLATNNAAISA
jgi:predicted glycoside hydrolase/deacetylase ChbG (UPF0249 family)